MTRTGAPLNGIADPAQWSAPSDADLAALEDVELLAAISRLEDSARQIDVARARFSSEVARRSRKELGNAGLAARHGHISAEALLKSLTRISSQDASRRIRVGAMLTDVSARVELGEAPALGSIASALLDGRLGLDGADHVIRALEAVISDVDPVQLAEATAELAVDASTLDADGIGILARGIRDCLDRVGVIDRERHLRSQRSLRRGRVIDGLRKVSMVLDPETDAIIMGAIDQAMSPRLGGPRFTRADDVRRSELLLADERSNEQIALDTLTDLVRVGVDRDDGTILGSIKPALRVTIDVNDLTRAVDALGVEHPDTDTGVAWLEGCSEALSAATARRVLCDAGALPIVLNGCSQPLDLGSPRRLFSGPQRIALAVRDGGCRVDGCDRPPSWCEAHHIDPHGGGGPTDIDNGVLLCRRHHLLFHDHGWQIIRTDQPGELLLVPPPSIDPTRTPLPMPSKRPRWLKPG